MSIQKLFSNSKFIAVLLLIILLSVVSCTPQSKDTYITQYNDFITKVSSEHQTYTATDWRDIERKYHKFSKVWFDKFKNDLTIKDHIILTKNKVQFNLCKINYNSKLITGYDVSKDYDKLKQQIKFYTENDMKDDLKIMIDQAHKIGGDIENSVNEILKEYDVNTTDSNH